MSNIRNDRPTQIPESLFQQRWDATFKRDKGRTRRLDSSRRRRVNRTDHTLPRGE